MSNFNYIDSLHSSAGVTSQNTHTNSSGSVNNSSSESIWTGYGKNASANAMDEQAAAEKFMKDQEAATLGLKPSGNSNYYFDEKNGLYYLWNGDKGFFKKDSNIVKVCGNGNYVDKKGTYYTPDGNKYAVVKDGVIKTDEITCGVSKYQASLARQRGYLNTGNGNIYCKRDENNNNIYYMYDKESLTFSKTNINDVLANGMYSADGKFFDVNGQEISEIRYIAGSQLLKPMGETSDVYKLESFDIYYKWNTDSKKFEPVKNDGVLGDFKQGQTGDCWLLASISAITSDEKGKEVIKNALSVNDDGSVNVYFKGIDKTYTITKNELYTTISKDYAAADPDVVAVELAMEKYRKGLLDTNLARGTALNLIYAPKNTGSVLDGGDPVQALQLLTGKKAINIGTDGNDKMALNSVVQEGKSFKAALKEYADNPNNVIVVSLKEGVDEKGNTKYHAYAFDSYDDENFYLVNPHDTFEGSQPISKEEFFKSVNSFSVVDLSSEDVETPTVIMSGEGKKISFAEFLPD